MEYQSMKLELKTEESDSDSDHGISDPGKGKKIKQNNW